MEGCKVTATDLNCFSTSKSVNIRRVLNNQLVNCKLLNKHCQHLVFLSKAISSVTIERTPTFISEFTLTHNSSSKYTLCLFPSQKSTCLWHLKFVFVKCPGVFIFANTVRGQRGQQWVQLGGFSLQALTFLGRLSVRRHKTALEGKRKLFR